MGKFVYIIATMVFSSVASAQVTCLGFAPEVTVVCKDSGGAQKIHAWEEEDCGLGRVGMLNDQDMIEKVEGPYRQEIDGPAAVTFLYNGESVTLSDCKEIN